jgi:hypothetical protein
MRYLSRQRFVARVFTAGMASLALTACRDDATGPQITPQLDVLTSPSPQAFAFTIIADSRRDTFNPFQFGCPVINDNGVVAFRGRQNVGLFTGVFRGSGGPLATIAHERNDSLAVIGREISMNNRGTVSFWSTLPVPRGDAILRGNGAVLRTIARTQPGTFNLLRFETSLNDSGRVAFKAELDNGDRGLFVGTPTRVDTVYRASSSQFRGSLDGPAINNRGQIAFKEDLDAGPSGLFLWNGSNFVTIATTAGNIDSVRFFPSLNNNGAVAFSARLDNGGAAIFRGSGGTLTTIANTAGPFSDFAFDPAINDAGRVAFTALLDGGGTGIFVTPNPASNRVVGTGDTIGGRRVDAVFLCREGLNLRGQLAFHAFLEDGHALIVRATPAAAPGLPNATQ